MCWNECRIDRCATRDMEVSGHAQVYVPNEYGSLVDEIDGRCRRDTY